MESWSASRKNIWRQKNYRDKKRSDTKMNILRIKSLWTLFMNGRCLGDESLQCSEHVICVAWFQLIILMQLLSTWSLIKNINGWIKNRKSLNGRNRMRKYVQCSMHSYCSRVKICLHSLLSWIRWNFSSIEWEHARIQQQKLSQ